jgi:RNA polymerase sigma-70 factor (ECF subfamily)
MQQATVPKHDVTTRINLAADHRRNRIMNFTENSIFNVETPARTVADLVRAAQAGDRNAFGELFERYRPGIVALAMRRVRNADEAEELAQDVFIQAMQKIDQLRVPEAFGGWLRRIVHRMAINRMTRTRSALACDPETLEATCLAEGTPDKFAQDREQAAAVRDGIHRLGSLDQQTLEAFYLQSKSLIEMSDEFDAPVGTIKRRLHVARKRLAKEMDVVQAV